MALSDAQIRFFADYIEQQLGIIYSPQVYYQLEQRLERVADYLQLKGSAAIYEKAKGEGIRGDFKQYLLDIATNNETSFFRDPKVFAAIKNKIIPKFKEKFPVSFNYRIWSAASSFGQEPYSLAMIVKEFLDANPQHARIEIIGTDISDQALNRCKKGEYTQLEVQRGLPAAQLVKYFEKSPSGSWNLKPEIKRFTDFRKQNLLEPFTSLGKFHLILCRYVLIYQDAEKKKAILKNIENLLHPNGYLIMGASESAFGLSSTLIQEDVDGAICYRKA